MPFKAKMKIPSGTSDTDIKDNAYEILETLSVESQAANTGHTKRTDLLMDRIVLGYKKSQYLFRQIHPEFQYRCSDYMETIFFDEDPVLGKILKDLSRMILDYLSEAVVRENFTGFNPYERKLLDAAMAYAVEGVGVCEKVLQKTLDSHKTMAQASLAEAYNGYGRALNYLGRNPEATAAFQIALQLDPDNAEARYYLDYLLEYLRSAKN